MEQVGGRGKSAEAGLQVEKLRFLNLDSIYSGPSVPEGFASPGSTNLRSKIFGGKIFPQRSRKHNLNLSHAGNHLHGIYIGLGIISNPEMI